MFRLCAAGIPNEKLRHSVNIGLANACAHGDRRNLTALRTFLSPSWTIRQGTTKIQKVEEISPAYMPKASLDRYRSMILQFWRTCWHFPSESNLGTEHEEEEQLHEAGSSGRSRQTPFWLALMSAKRCNVSAVRLLESTTKVYTAVVGLTNCMRSWRSRISLHISDRAECALKTCTVRISWRVKDKAPRYIQKHICRRDQPSLSLRHHSIETLLRVHHDFGIWWRDPSDLNVQMLFNDMAART